MSLSKENVRLLIASLATTLMVITSLTAFYFSSRQDTNRIQRNDFELSKMVPHKIGEWTFEPKLKAAVVNPQTQELLDKIYSQILTRVYVNSSGQSVMLSIAYGRDQRGGLQAHNPEVCYPAQGFKLETSIEDKIQTPFGQIQVKRMKTTKGSRFEPVTYWFTIGDQQVLSRMEQRLAVIKSTLTGQIPDGLLFRVSSVDRNSALAYQYQDDFVNQLLSVLGPAERLRLSGFIAAQ
jgi:EpsI family protein